MTSVTNDTVLTQTLPLFLPLASTTITITVVTLLLRLVRLVRELLLLVLPHTSTIILLLLACVVRVEPQHLYVDTLARAKPFSHAVVASGSAGGEDARGGSPVDSESGDWLWKVEQGKGMFTNHRRQLRRDLGWTGWMEKCAALMCSVAW